MSPTERTPAEPQSAGQAPSQALVALRQLNEKADEISRSFTDLRVKHSLNLVEYSGRAKLSSVNLSGLTELARNGHTVDVRIGRGDWVLDLRRGHEGEMTNSEGPLSAAVDQSRIDALERALESRELVSILGMLSMHDAELNIRVINDAKSSGTHWIQGVRHLADEVRAGQWVPLAHAITTGPNTLLVEDLGAARLANGAFVVYGPDAPSIEEGEGDACSLGERDRVIAMDMPFRVGRVGEGAVYPTPMVFSPLTLELGESADATAAVQRLFCDLAFLLCWAHLANTRTAIEGGLRVTVSGTRQLHLDVVPTSFPHGSLDDISQLLALYRWVALSPEVDRLYFAEQALTLAVVNQEDIPTSAGPAYRTALSLYQLSRQNSVAEVMTSRRSAREVALAAARSAAGHARDACGKAVERVVVQAIAAAGLLVARFQASLPASLTAGLLFLVVGICLVSAYVTEHVTLRSAEQGLRKELEDLDQFRDSLSEADLLAIRGGGAITAARDDLNRTKATARSTYLGTAIVAGMAGVLVLILAVDGGTSRPIEDPVPSVGMSSSGVPNELEPSNTGTPKTPQGQNVGRPTPESTG